MSEQSGSSQGRQERTELPIERGFPIEQINEIAEREGRGIAKQYYRPLYTMHKWWARRLGSVFRAISLYTLIDDSTTVRVRNPGENGTLDDYGDENTEIGHMINNVDLENPDGLWPLYKKDTRIEGKRVLDPFMGGGTSVVETSRFEAQVDGIDLNPVSWFVSKKEIDAGETDIEKLESAYEELSNNISSELKQFYKTNCPHDHSHEADVMSYFWVKEVDCVSCGEAVPLFDDYRVAKGRYDNSDKYHVYCKECNSVTLVDDWRSESLCGECGSSIQPSDGNTGNRSPKYSCHSCGQKYKIIDAVQEQGGFNLRQFALEYHCPECENENKNKEKIKSYKAVTDKDEKLYQNAKEEWENSPELHKYVPEGEIPLGIKTDSTKFEGSIGGGHSLLRHGFDSWTDLFNDRQLLTYAKLLREIDQIDNQNIKEFFLLSASDSLRGSSLLVNYQKGGNAMDHVFKSNSFDPPKQPAENNPWGADAGARNFRRSVERMLNGVAYAREPFDRYPENGEMIKSPPFQTSVGKTATVKQGNSLELVAEDEYDAVITDPPYYDNVIYSELSNYFYVWQRILLKDTYDWFKPASTPRSESIVANPAEQKGAQEFEDELRVAFERILTSLKDDGALVFTYHHSNSESWGELLQALCDVGFEVTATYPVTVDLDKIVEGESVSFDIIIVARPAQDRKSTSWNALRRTIYRTARRTRKKLEENRDLSRGDIGVMEMGACFHEYSKHHRKVQREGEIMSAKEVVQEIYGIIQEASDIGVEDVFIDLLDTPNPSFDDVNKLCRGTNAKPEELKAMHLYNQDDGFELGTWDNEKRQAYIQERANGDGGDHLSNLDKLQFLRYRYEKGQAVQNYVEKWDVDDDMRELAGRLADVTGDDTYTRVLGDRDITSY